MWSGQETFVWLLAVGWSWVYRTSVTNPLGNGAVHKSEMFVTLIV